MPGSLESSALGRVRASQSCFGLASKFRDGDKTPSERDDYRNGSAALPAAKSCQSERFDAAGICLLHRFSAGLVEIPGFSLPHVSRARRLLAKEMILMVAQFHTEVVGIFSDGRNSGQERGKRGADIRRFHSATGAPTQARAFNPVNCCAWGRESPRPRTQQVRRFVPRTGSGRRSRR